MRLESGAIIIGLGLEVVFLVLGLVVKVIPDWLAYIGLVSGGILILIGLVIWIWPTRGKPQTVVGRDTNVNLAGRDAQQYQAGRDIIVGSSPTVPATEIAEISVEEVVDERVKSLLVTNAGACSIRVTASARILYPKPTRTWYSLSWQASIEKYTELVPGDSDRANIARWAMEELGSKHRQRWHTIFYEFPRDGFKRAYCEPDIEQTPETTLIEIRFIADPSLDEPLLQRYRIGYKLPLGGLTMQLVPDTPDSQTESTSE